jgi:hypothetical protein
MPRYPEEKMWMTFNYDVDLDSVRNRVHIYYKDKGEPAIPLTITYGTRTEYETDKDGKQIEKTLENKSSPNTPPLSLWVF